MQNVTKVVPMINGVEVKVGQVWSDGNGKHGTIISINNSTDRPIETNAGHFYSYDGKPFIEIPEYCLTRLIKDVKKEQVFTRSELSALIEVNSYEIKYLTGRINLNQEHAKIYYNLCDKAVKETSPYFVELNKARNAVKKYKAKLKKLVAAQVKLKEMYNSSK